MDSSWKALSAALYIIRIRPFVLELVSNRMCYVHLTERLFSIRMCYLRYIAHFNTKRSYIAHSVIGCNKSKFSVFPIFHIKMCYVHQIAHSNTEKPFSIRMCYLKNEILEAKMNWFQTTYLHQITHVGRKYRSITHGKKSKM